MLVRNEAVALKAIKCAKAGDLIVVFYEELDEILEIIHEESSRYNEDIISSIRRKLYRQI